MTVEMFSSEEPWAVATTLIPFFPSAPKSRAETPVYFSCSHRSQLSRSGLLHFHLLNEVVADLKSKCFLDSGLCLRGITGTDREGDRMLGTPWVIRMTFTFD